MSQKLKNRIQSEAKTVMRITNQDLVCKDCKSRFDDRVKFGNTSACKKYDLKPNQVLLGKSCEKYEKEVSDEDSVRV